MNKPAHTPGPWSAVLDPCPATKNRWLIEKREQGWKTLIAEVYAGPEHNGGPEWQGTKEANARLISLAPTLLLGLKASECTLRVIGDAFEEEGRHSKLAKEIRSKADICAIAISMAEGKL